MRPFMISHAALQPRDAIKELPDHELALVTGGAAADFSYGFIISGPGARRTPLFRTYRKTLNKPPDLSRLDGHTPTRLCKIDSDRGFHPEGRHAKTA